MEGRTRAAEAAAFALASAKGEEDSSSAHGRALYLLLINETGYLLSNKETLARGGGSSAAAVAPAQEKKKQPANIKVRPSAVCVCLRVHYSLAYAR